jgi:hypothetical protein
MTLFTYTARSFTKLSRDGGRRRTGTAGAAVSGELVVAPGGVAGRGVD